MLGGIGDRLNVVRGLFREGSHRHRLFIGLLRGGEQGLGRLFHLVGGLGNAIDHSQHTGFKMIGNLPVFLQLAFQGFGHHIDGLGGNAIGPVHPAFHQTAMEFIIGHLAQRRLRFADKRIRGINGPVDGPGQTAQRIGAPSNQQHPAFQSTLGTVIQHFNAGFQSSPHPPQRPQPGQIDKETHRSDDCRDIRLGQEQQNGGNTPQPGADDQHGRNGIQRGKLTFVHSRIPYRLKTSSE